MKEKISQTGLPGGAVRLKPVSRLTILILTVWAFALPRGFAQPEEVPADALKLKPGGYVYADYPGVFDDVEGDGITVEAWIYLTGKPEDGDHALSSVGQWIIFAKPGSYYVSISGMHVPQRGAILPDGSTWLNFGIGVQPDSFGWTWDDWGESIPPEDYPRSRWVHLAQQIVERNDEAHAYHYFERVLISQSGPLEPVGRTSAPFLIGGTPIVKFAEGSEWGRLYESMLGYVDEVRVSKGFRYGTERGNRIQPERKFRADGKTVALWRFEEGPAATLYRDSSGNGYTLFPGGSLSVSPRGKLTTTWGALKRPSSMR